MFDFSKSGEVVKAVDGVSMDMYQGEIFCLLGMWSSDSLSLSLTLMPSVRHCVFALTICIKCLFRAQRSGQDHDHWNDDWFAGYHGGQCLD